MDKERIIDKIDALKNNSRPEDCKKLKGNNKPPLYRIRLGNYRIILSIQYELLCVLMAWVGHNKKYIPIAIIL